MIFAVTSTRAKAWWAAGRAGSQHGSRPASVGAGFIHGSTCLVAVCLLPPCAGFAQGTPGAESWQRVAPRICLGNREEEADCGKTLYKSIPKESQN